MPWANGILLMTAVLLGGCASASISRESVWVCRRPDCVESQMVRSGRDEWMDDTKVHLVTVRGMLAVNFDLEEGHEIDKAGITDCHGTSAALPSEQLKAPAAHNVEDGSGWAVFVLPAQLAGLDQSCGLMTLSVRERRDDKTWDHTFALSHHPKIGWVSDDELREDDELWPSQ